MIYVICKRMIFRFLNEPVFICLHIVKWLDVWSVSQKFVGNFILNESELIHLHTSITIVCTQLNSSKYCYVLLAIQ